MNELKKRSLSLLVVETQELYEYLYSSTPFTEQIDVLHILSDIDEVDMLSKIALHEPDVLLISIPKLDEDTLNVIVKVRARHRNLSIAVLLFSFNSGDADAIRKLTVEGEGGLAVFLRQSLKELRQFINMLQAVKFGQRIFDPMMTSYLFGGKTRGKYLSQLTNREMETLSLLAEGYSNAAIAELMFIDEKTVEHHLNSIYGKLRADSDFEKRHLRVAASRLYYEEVGAR